MTEQEKQLLLKDLCSRLPYGIKCSYPYGCGKLVNIDIDSEEIQYIILVFDSPDDNDYPLDSRIQPYLRTMSSMTELERNEFRTLGGVMSYNSQHDHWTISAFTPGAYDWLNAHHFDYRGLITMGLAIEVTEENNPYC